MQNPHIVDLISGDGTPRKGYSKCIYIRKDTKDARAKELKDAGYIFVEENEQSDLALYGIPAEEVEEVAEEVVEDKEDENVEENETKTP